MEMAQRMGAQLLPQFPVFIAWIAAMVLAALRWQRTPRVSMLVLIALGILWLAALAGAFVSSWLPFAMRDRGMSSAQIGATAALWAWILGFVRAGGWALLIVAIFGGRERPAGAPGAGGNAAADAGP